MPEKMRTRPTNLAGGTAPMRERGCAARETLGAWGAVPRRGLPSDAPRNPAMGGKGRTRAEARLPLDAQYRAIYASPVDPATGGRSPRSPDGERHRRGPHRPLERRPARAGARL